MSISQNFPEEGPSLNLNFAGSRTLDPRITFSRSQTTSNGSTYMGRDGLIKYAGPDEPRFDHRYVNGEVESLGLLIEESRTNSATYSNDLSTWGSVYSQTLTQDVVGPDGIVNSAWTFDDTYTGGVNYTTYVARSIPTTAPFKIIQALKKDSSTFGVDGVMTTTDTSVEMPVGVNQLLIGVGNWGGTIQQLVYYPTALPSNQLITLTK